MRRHKALHESGERFKLRVDRLLGQHIWPKTTASRMNRTSCTRNQLISLVQTHSPSSLGVVASPCLALGSRVPRDMQLVMQSGPIPELADHSQKRTGRDGNWPSVDVHLSVQCLRAGSGAYRSHARVRADGHYKWSQRVKPPSCPQVEQT